MIYINEGFFPYLIRTLPVLITAQANWLDDISLSWSRRRFSLIVARYFASVTVPISEPVVVFAEQVAGFIFNFVVEPTTIV